MSNRCVDRFCIWLLAVCGSQAANVFVLNHSPEPVELKKPSKTLAAGKSWAGSRKERTFGAGKGLELLKPKFRAALPDDRYAVVVVEASGEVTVHDTNALQIEISNAAQACISQHNTDQWATCLAEQTFGGGIPSKQTAAAFDDLWGGYSFWHTCTILEPAPPLRSLTSKAGFKVDIIREKPLVAAVRGFVSPVKCKSLLSLPQVSNLVRAHTGTGGGGTATSESRETLTTNLFVNWDVKDDLSVHAATQFDLVSELHGTNFSYEGQEPINFLYYLRGYEYRPHMDGSANGKGKRAATTLTYCVAPGEGGSTVFTQGEPIRFQPGVGDLLYFGYNYKPHLTMHAACPVARGTKSTLTQWYRPDVSLSTNWDQFEDWGKFHNPHGASKWKGARFVGKHDEL